MKLLKLFSLTASLFFIQNTYATTWYLDEDDILKNDDIPELSILNQKGSFLFFIDKKRLPLVKKGRLAQVTSSAALINSVTDKNKICIEAVIGANSKQQDIKNIYIIHNKTKVVAFQTKKMNVTCESELKIKQK